MRPRDFECGVVNAWEERIWLDRREDASMFFPTKPTGLAGLKERWHRFAARMQLGPVAPGDAWSDRENEQRF